MNPTNNTNDTPDIEIGTVDSRWTWWTQNNRHQFDREDCAELVCTLCTVLFSAAGCAVIVLLNNGNFAF